jgi:hypothetical protein
MSLCLPKLQEIHPGFYENLMSNWNEENSDFHNWVVRANACFTQICSLYWQKRYELVIELYNFCEALDAFRPNVMVIKEPSCMITQQEITIQNIRQTVFKIVQEANKILLSEKQQANR